MRATPDVARATPTVARRRCERRTRSFFRHGQMAVEMAVISSQHHPAQRCCPIATQTDDYVATSATCFNMSDGDDSDEPAAPVTELSRGTTSPHGIGEHVTRELTEKTYVLPDENVVTIGRAFPSRGHFGPASLTGPPVPRHFFSESS